MSGNDKAKRDAAVDAFSEAIKARLDEQAAKGYTGWDGAYSYYDLCEEISMDVVRASQLRTTECGKYAVDIGARAMMLHFRAGVAKKGGKG
jgi:hypothetical protein